VKGERNSAYFDKEVYRTMLREIYDYLKSKAKSSNGYYAIPYLWASQNVINAFPPGERPVSDERKPLIVNPYKYFSGILSEILDLKKPGIHYERPFSTLKEQTGHAGLPAERDWLQSRYMYGFFVRATTAYNHKGYWKFQGSQVGRYTEGGTFLKMIALLPYLKKIGIDTLYSLPITKYSHLYRKGEVSSPYAVKNFLQIEPAYKDALLQGFTVEEEFSAFVEAAHMMGMRVILDFVPRTCSRDNDLILEHPDWFYWIRPETEAEYKAPFIDGLDFCQPSVENLPAIYASERTKDLLGFFSHSPDRLEPQKWERFKQEHQGKENDFFKDLVKTFGVLPPPGFSDWVNDSQPAWTDVTFLKLFHLPPNPSRTYVAAEQPPYVLFDIIKASNFENDSPNRPLWEYLEGVIPSYQKRFGIDGVRLDMGHALPRPLEGEIIRKARDWDPGFVFIAEELEISKDEKALEHGYDAILGNSWWMEPRVDEGKCFEFCQERLPTLKLPALATAETPDTPRAIARKYHKRFSKFAFILNLFLPNGITFLNSGFEIGEVQPLNLGLDNREEGRFMLPEQDPLYGKIAFFDHYAYHWDQADLELLQLMQSAAPLKTECGEWCRGENRLEGLFTPSEKVIAHLYKNPIQNQALVLLANTDFENGSWISIDVSHIPDMKIGGVKREYENYTKTHRYMNLEDGYVHAFLEPGEATILTLR